MAPPEDLLFSKEHEWVQIEGDAATIGVTDYAQNALGDIVYVELPKVGSTIAQFANVGVIESVKAVSDLFTPISGEVVEVNAALDGDPAAVNREPYGAGWLLKIRPVESGRDKKSALTRRVRENRHRLVVPRAARASAVHRIADAEALRVGQVGIAVKIVRDEVKDVSLLLRRELAARHLPVSHVEPDAPGDPAVGEPSQRTIGPLAGDVLCKTRRERFAARRVLRA